MRPGHELLAIIEGTLASPAFDNLPLTRALYRSAAIRYRRHYDMDLSGYEATLDRVAKEMEGENA